MPGNSGEMNGAELVLKAARFEGADFLLDMETSVPRKKRCWDQAFCDDGYGRVDEDYVSFLDDLHSFWEAKFALEEEEDEEEEEDDDDPTYLAFLKKLKVHGTAYKCDVSPKNGVLFPIIYEEEEEEEEEEKKNKKRTGDHPDGMKKRRRTPMSNSDDYLRENQSVDLKAGQSPFPKFSDFGKQMLIIDDDYQFFMDKLHYDGEHSYFEYGDQSRIYYEAGDQQTIGLEVEPLRAVARPSSSIIRPPASTFKTQSANPKQQAPRYVQNMRNQQTTGSEVEPRKADARPVAPILRPSTSIPRPPALSSKLQFANSKQTPCYVKNSRNQQTIGLEVEPSKADARPPASPLRTQIANPKQRTPTDVQNTLTASNKAKKKLEQDKEELSAYWSELHSYLRKPYDQKEYDSLYEFVSIRKPVSVYKESRRGGYFMMGHLGKSYLDIYPDLKYEIEKVSSDQHKVLNLLRMCAIYVQKIPSLPFGYITPWRHDLTKTILPGSSDGR